LEAAARAEMPDRRYRCRGGIEARCAHVYARLGSLGAGTAGVVSRDIGNGVSRDIGDGVRLGVAASAG
jgi:hypothetical protein